MIKNKNSENREFLVLEDLYANHLETLTGVKFSPREVEILSFIVAGKSAKVSGLALDLSYRTIESYIYNIKSKIRAGSREEIIQFIETSGKRQYLEKYYVGLLERRSFERSLAKISDLLLQKEITCYFSHSFKSSSHMTLFQTLTKHLLLLGVKIAKEELSSKKYDILEKDIYILWHIPNSLQNMIFLFLDTQSQADVQKKIPGNNCIFLSDYNNYYALFFGLIKSFFPEISLDKSIIEFTQLMDKRSTQHKNITLSSSHFYNSNLLKNFYKNIINYLFFNHSTIYIKYITKKIMNYSYLIVFLLVYILSSKLYLEHTEIHSDLPLPPDSNFLKRPQIISQIESKLEKKGDKITLVAITGIGGVGKTILARYYARSHSASVNWEINAESKETLVNSFKNLAYALAQTKEQKDVLIFTQQIQSDEEKEKQLLFFVKNQLKHHKNWLLIFDNVESFSSIKAFFPHDPEVWGKGRIIIITQNSNIQDIGFIKFDNTIFVDELNLDEALAFFCKILYDLDPSQLTEEQREQTKAFLTYIPQFPLDVSLAAYYIKGSQISYEQYLDRINQHNKKLDATQEKLIKEVSDYTKTRSSIIRLSFQKLIESNPEFKDLLFLIYFLDSQNIPKSLLESYKDPVLVEKFIHELKRYSLITNILSEKNKKIAFSIHSSIQNFGRTYLLDLLNDTDKKIILNKIIPFLNKFYENFEHKEMLYSHLTALQQNLDSTGLFKILTPLSIDTLTQLIKLRDTHLQLLKSK